MHTERYEGPKGSGQILQLTFDEYDQVVDWVVFTPAKDNLTTEQLVEALMGRGYRVVLERPSAK